LRGRWREAPDEVVPQSPHTLPRLAGARAPKAFPLRGRWREAPDEVVPQSPHTLPRLAGTRAPVGDALTPQGVSVPVFAEQIQFAAGKSGGE